MLTDSQKKALAFRHQMSVTANAGAGKTTVLIQRFVEILLQTDTRVNEIVAITFTEKAASELRTKIAREVEKRILHAPSAREKVHLEHIRDQLISANIGTIHSFCAQLLREYPVEADVDAAFTVLDGVDQQVLANESLRATFEQILSKSDDSSERDRVFDLMKMFGRKRVEEDLITFLKKRELLDRLLQDGGCLAESLSDESILMTWRRKVEGSIVNEIDDSSWREGIQRLLPVASGKSVEEVRGLVKSWSKELPAAEKISCYSDIVRLVLTQKGTLRKEFIGSKTDAASLDGTVKTLADQWSSMSDLISSSTSTEGEKANRILLTTIRTLLRLYKQVASTFATKKGEYGQLDFEDLQLKTRELLRQEEVRTKLSSRFKFVMVDEFQDTNRLQYEILGQLLSSFELGNLFVVGDPKQSIYGFRDAEVEIFDDVKRSLERLRGGTGKAVVLAESFRLLPNLVDFVNRVFSQTMSEGSTVHEVHYDDLIQGRNNRAEGKVELLLIPEERESSHQDDADAIRQECRRIASRISVLVREKHVVYHGTEEAPRSSEFKDVAILLRNRTHVRSLERALHERHIPYALSGGIGFYQTQELYDFLNYFTFLLSAGDDVALAGILRSPFFVISDAELFEISRQNASSLWKKMCLFVSSGDASPELKRAVDALTLHQDLVHRLPIQLLVQRVFLQTGWRGTISGLPFGGQTIANIQKLLRLAREFEGKGFTTMYDFVQRLRSLAESEDREGQAAFVVDGNSVHVMTIHAAKGLEFPIVFIPFTHEEFRYDRPPLFDSGLGVACKVRDDRELDRELISPLFHLVLRRSNQKREAEEKRIFYVACTRARDMIVLSGQYDQRAGHPSYLRWIVDSLRIEPSNLREGEILFPATALKYIGESDGKQTPNEIPHHLKVIVGLSALNERTISRQPQKHESIRPPEKIFTELLHSRSHGEFVSATQIKTFLECPTKYYLKYRLGIPDKGTVPYDFDEDDESNDFILGEVEGLLTHALLQDIFDSAITEEEIRTRATRLVRTKSLQIVSRKDSLIEAITHNALSFINSTFGGTVLAAIEGKTEFSLSAAHADDFLTGTIDRMYKDAQGWWRIVDYKTDKVKRDEMRTRAEIYKPQLLTYAVLVKRLFGQRSVNATLIFLRYPSEPIHFDFTSAELKSFEGTIDEILDRIRTNRFDHCDEMCESCSFQNEKSCLIPSLSQDT